LRKDYKLKISNIKKEKMRDNTLKLTNKLAKERTQLSNERTMLAYLRTAFSLFLFAIAFLKLFED